MAKSENRITKESVLLWFLPEEDANGKWSQIERSDYVVVIFNLYVKGRMWCASIEVILKPKRSGTYVAKYGKNGKDFCPIKVVILGKF